MSINLHCNKIDLWQTPTYITYMCLETSTLKSALKAYLYWISNQSIKVIKTPEDQKLADQQREQIRIHTNEVVAVLDMADLEVFGL